MAKPQFASKQHYSCKGNSGEHERAVLLEDLFLIRICSRDPGPHIMTKQRLVGASGELLAFSGFRTVAAATHFWAATVWQLFLLKNKTLQRTLVASQSR
jgi:hypothetical protein